MAEMSIVLGIIAILMTGGISLSKKVVNEDDKGKRQKKALIMCGFFIGAIMFSAVYGTVTERQTQKAKIQNNAVEEVLPAKIPAQTM